MGKRIFFIAIAFLSVLAGCDSGNEVQDPRISITNMDETALPPTGGPVSIGYEIINPAENGELKAEPSIGWMSGFRISDTRISFSVEANNTGSSRPGIIKLTYTYGDSLSTTLDVNVTQETMQEGDVATPVIEFDEDPVNLAAEGGQGEITYTVINPAAGATVTAELDNSNVGWLSGFNCETEGVITFDVELNESTESRSAVVNITYAYGDKSIFKQVSVVQAGASVYEFEMTHMYLNSVGTLSPGNGYNFMLKLSDMPISEYGNLDNNGTGYQFDLYSRESGSKPSAGTYKVDMNNSTEPETLGFYSSFALIDKQSLTFTDGTVTISYEGDNINIVCSLVDVNHSIHSVTYTGTIEDSGDDDGISCLTDDYTLNLSGATVTYDSEPSFMIPMWQFEFKPANMTGDGLFIELYAWTENGAAFPTGTFGASSDIYSEEGFYPGAIAYGMPRGTMYYKYQSGGKTGDMAPAISGDLTIADNGNGTHTISFDFVDDKGHTWSGEWTGTVYEAY